MPLLQDIFKTLFSKQLPEQTRLNLKTGVNLVGFTFFLTFLSAIALTTALTTSNYNDDNHAIAKLIVENGIFVVFFSATILAPIVEEISFRGIFTNNKNVFLISIFFLLISIGLYLNIPLEIITIFSVLLLILSFTKKGGEFINKLKSIILAHFGILLWIMSILFATVHLSNYNDIVIAWYLWPVLVLPQLIAGIVLSYIRIKFGLRFSILFHALMNTILFLPSVILESFGESYLETVSLIYFMILFASLLIFIRILYKSIAFKKNTI
jgi:membrane protease YdiL (CAAX protease family)